jgi:UDP:flavonoid glycosyltransferase YjiC (YdhE family)
VSPPYEQPHTAVPSAGSPLGVPKPASFDLGRPGQLRVLGACSLGGAGHFNPLVPLLQAARRRGDEVLVVGPPALGEMVERAGFPFWAGGEPTELEVAPIRERFPVAPAAEASVLGNRELFGRLATLAMLTEMERAFAHWRPDLVLREPCEYASAIVAAQTSTPVAQVAISLAEAEAGSIATAAPALEQHRGGLVGELRASPYLTRFPASLDPSPFESTMRFRDPDGTPASLPDWWAGSDAPLIYATFGTVLGYMSIAADVYRMVLAAVEDMEARVLLTVGRRFDRAMLGPVPAHVRVEAWIDQAEVLGHADLVVCHGGSGTALGALAAGVPLVAVPLFADQFENARRIAATGAGLVVENATGSPRGARRPIDARAAPRVAHSIEAVLGNAAYRRRARSIAAEMAAAPSTDELLARLGSRPR